MSNEQIEELLAEFCLRMRKPPLDEDEKNVIRSYIRSGAAILNAHALQKNVDYTQDRAGKELLYNFVFYADNDAQDRFESAYKPQLIRFHNAARLDDVIEVTG